MVPRGGANFDPILLVPPMLVYRVKGYESKLAALSAINSALQKENDKLRKDAARLPVSDAGAWSTGGTHSPAVLCACP